MSTTPTTIKPLADRVIVTPDQAEQEKNGIIIPDTAKQKPSRGTVTAVGSGTNEIPLTVKVGDTVLYGKYAGTEVTINNQLQIILRESDIFAII